MYSTWNIVALKAKLREQGASTRGRKADLVERLEAYDRNMNFDGIENDENDDLRMVLPEPNAFWDIKSSMKLPSLTKEHITLFFLQFQKSPKEGLALYELRFLHVLRVAPADGFVHLKGFVKASMKRIIYEVNIKVRLNGEIEESTCECMAGQGVSAHCKLVAVVLCGTEHFVNNNILLKTVTSTETLQTFHKPKKIFTGSPIRSHNLPTKRKKENIVFHPYKKQINVQEYNQRVRSIVLNENSLMPLKQLYEPANPYGIDNNHSYLGSLSNKVLADLELTNMSPCRVREIERETRGQQNNSNWWKFRHCRLTASIFNTICRMREPTKKNFANQILNKKKIVSRATTHGILNEKVALKEYIDLYNLDVIESGLHISQERPYLAASPDGLLYEDTIIEIKCPYTTRREKISPITVPYLVLVEGNLELKKETPYYYQIQGQLYCAHKKYCNLIVYSYESMEVVFVNRDEEFIKQMLSKLDSYYNNYFKESVLNHHYYKDYLDLIMK